MTNPETRAVNSLDEPLPVYLKLVAVAAIWGGTFVAGHVAAAALPHFTVAACRFLVAVVLLLILAWKSEGGLPRLNRQQRVTTFALGVTGVFLYNTCFFSALTQLPAGRTALFVAFNPIVTALLLAALFGERLGASKWLGIAVALIGAAVIVTRGDLAGAARDLSRDFGPGEGYMLGAVLSWAAYTIIGRFALRGLSPIAATTYAALWGVLLLGIASVPEWPEVQLAAFSGQVIASIVYLGALGTVVGFVWYYQGVRALGPSRTSVFNNLVPVFGVLLATVLLGEPLLWSMLAGGALVIAGVSLTNRTPARPSVSAQPSGENQTSTANPRV